MTSPAAAFPYNLWCAVQDDPSDDQSGDPSPRHQAASRHDAITATPANGAAISSVDRTRVDAIRADDSVTFDGLVTEYWIPLCGFATGYVKDADIAKELVADVFAALWTRRKSWQVSTTIEAYLFGAVRNRARTAHRDITRRAALLRTATIEGEIPTPAVVPAPDANILTTRETDDLTRQVYAAIDALPPRLRDATVLRWERQMEYDAIAEALSVSPAAARQLVSRALRLLRGALARTPSAG